MQHAVVLAGFRLWRSPFWFDAVGATSSLAAVRARGVDEHQRTYRMYQGRRSTGAPLFLFPCSRSLEL